MNKTIGRRAVARVLLGMAVLGAVALPGRAQDRLAAAPAELSTAVAVDTMSLPELKSAAFSALRAGEFDRTNLLLTRAASISDDPAVQRMAQWTSEFEKQRQVFQSERREQYDKAVGDVKKLIEAGYRDYALDYAARAYLLADNKDAFHSEPWVADLIKQSIASAEEADKAQQWVKSLRLYGDLGSIEPANPLWKERLKVATRRIRLLAMYAPEALKATRDAEASTAEKVLAIVKPEMANKSLTGTTRPATESAESEDSAFKIDWRETLRGIRRDMLWQSLVKARENYWRDTTYVDLVTGGLQGLRVLATTPGLEAAFPKLSDEALRSRFVADVDSAIAASTAAGEDPLKQSTIVAGVIRTNAETLQLDEEVLVSEFADGAFAELDPFTAMIWPSEVDEFRKTTQGEFSGVGIQIQSGDDGSLKVISPLEDSPAFRAGIKAGDVITHINGKSAKGITINQAVKTITGPSGTLVTLTVKSPDGESRDHEIKRETIKVASIKGYQHMPGGGWNYFVDPDNKIAYLRLTNFTKTTGEELDKAARELRDAGAAGVILDLRYNPGGLLTAATEVSDKFLTGGTIVSTRADRKTPNNPTEASASNDGDELSLPIVVLVNQYSASASEIVSGALKDQKAALVVGERTFGKGSVQMLFPLRGDSAFLKLTTSHYYLPSGRCIHREENSPEWGVDPDIRVEMTPEQMRAAQEARQEMDILRNQEDIPAPAEGAMPQLRDEAVEVEAEVKDAVAETGKKKNVLEADPQLSAAVLLLRLQLAGAQIQS